MSSWIRNKRDYCSFCLKQVEFVSMMSLLQFCTKFTFSGKGTKICQYSNLCISTPNDSMTSFSVFCLRLSSDDFRTACLFRLHCCSPVVTDFAKILLILIKNPCLTLASEQRMNISKHQAGYVRFMISIRQDVQLFLFCVNQFGYSNKLKNSLSLNS